MGTHAIADLTVVALAVAALATTGCVTRTHEENAARRSTWPTGSAVLSADAGRPTDDWPSVGGDILRTASPAELAAARAAISQPLTDDLTKP